MLLKDRALFLVAMAWLASSVAVAQFVRLPLPNPTERAVSLALGPDGNIWYTAVSGTGSGKIGRMTPGGTAVEYDLPTPIPGPSDIVAAPDGNLWFIEESAYKLGRISTNGVITEFAFLGGERPLSLTNGPDGALWITDLTHAIWRVSLDGWRTRFPIPVAPTRIATGADGNVWFTTENGPTQIGRLTPSGAVTMVPIHQGNLTSGCTLGPDGKVWFTTFSRFLGSVDSTGQVAVFPFTGPGLGAGGVAVGSDGNLWTTTSAHGVCIVGLCTPSYSGVLKVTTDGSQTSFTLPPELSVGEIARIAAGPNGSMWIASTDSLIRFFPAQLQGSVLGSVPAAGPFGLGALALLLALAAFWRLRR